MKKLFILLSLSILMASCSENQLPTESTSDKTTEKEKVAREDSAKKVNDARGIGKFKHVDIADKLDESLATGGKEVYDVKCSSCHRLTDEKLVGPGWKGVTQRRKPEWIMNFSTNTDEMLNKDPEAKAMLELCMIRMPNQNLSDADARKVYEYMRKNDGVK